MINFVFCSSSKVVAVKENWFTIAKVVVKISNLLILMDHTAVLCTGRRNYQETYFYIFVAY